MCGGLSYPFITHQLGHEKFKKFDFGQRNIHAKVFAIRMWYFELLFRAFSDNLKHILIVVGARN